MRINCPVVSPRFQRAGNLGPAYTADIPQRWPAINFIPDGNPIYLTLFIG